MSTPPNTANHPLASGNPPSWASGWGQDSYGVWVEFTVEGEDGPVTQRMRWIQPGRFVMGSPKDEPGRYDNEGPQHRVTISQGFWLFDTPVTQALWLAVMGENMSRFQSTDRPVETVSWNDCQQFLEKINRQYPGLDLSLPGEAQWEYACRAGSITALYTGPLVTLDENNAPVLHKIAWYVGNIGAGIKPKKGQSLSMSSLNDRHLSLYGSHPVAQKQPNDWGVYDMLGNILEWTADPWRENYQEEPESGNVWESNESIESGVYRVIRGGSWNDKARNCRSAYRSRSGFNNSYDYLGFRCARVQG